MCIIAYNPYGTLLNKDRLHIAYGNNRDGVGFMWREEDGRIESVKGFMDFDEVWNWVELLRNYTYALHFRFRTRGLRSEENCHPFEVLNHEKDGMDLLMMHNGTFNLKSFDGDKRSDTQIFADILHNEIHGWQNHSDLLRKPVIRRIEKAITSNNKIVFMTSQGKDAILHEDFGFWDNKIWYSNRYSFAR